MFSLVGLLEQVTSCYHGNLRIYVTKGSDNARDSMSITCTCKTSIIYEQLRRRNIQMVCKNQGDKIGMNNEYCHSDDV